MNRLERLRRDLDRLQVLRTRALKLNLGFQVAQADAQIEAIVREIQTRTK